MPLARLVKAKVKNSRSTTGITVQLRKSGRDTLARSGGDTPERRTCPDLRVGEITDCSSLLRVKWKRMVLPEYHCNTPGAVES